MYDILIMIHDSWFLVPSAQGNMRSSSSFLLAAAQIPPQFLQCFHCVHYFHYEMLQFEVHWKFCLQSLGPLQLLEMSIEKMNMFL